MTDHQTLLAEYRRNGSDTAFQELVSSYVALVYSTALRLVEGDRHQAEDVTQTVFVDLARLARTLPSEVRLGGWLHRHTCFVAANTLRGERRRQVRERQAVEMNTLQNHSETDFSQVAPLLDEAINELDEADRTAILLRFFEQNDFRSVGEALGSTEDAARMRVTRALEKLEGFLKRRGVTTSAASLGVVLTANAVQAAPVGLVATISTAAALAGTTATIATHATMNLINTKAITAIVATALVAGTGTYLVQQREAIRLRSEKQKLVAQSERLATERDTAFSAAAGSTDELERLRTNQNELLRLRNEVGMLRRQTNDLGRLRHEIAQLHASLAKPEQPSATPEVDSEVGMRVRLANLITQPLAMYAADNEGQFPTNFDAAASYFQKAYRTDPFLRDETELLEAAKQFEIVFHGSRNTLTNAGSVIVIRERQARQRPDGKWEKVYGFADGHGEGWVSQDDNYETRERLRPTLQTTDRPAAILGRSQSK